MPNVSLPFSREEPPLMDFVAMAGSWAGANAFVVEIVHLNVLNSSDSQIVTTIQNMPWLIGMDR